jgi:plastocyanin
MRDDQSGTTPRSLRVSRKVIGIGLLVPALAGLAISAWALAGGGSSAGSGREIRVQIDVSGFNPKSIEIGQGDTVVFENVGSEPHWPFSSYLNPTHRLYPGGGTESCGTDQQDASFDACAALMPGESYVFTFDYPGLWRFHDHLNTVLGAKVNVLPVEGAEAPEIQTGPTAVPEQAYDESIAENSQAIFEDDAALYSYVRKYGPLATIKYLSELQAQLGDCHRPAHLAGRFAYEILQDNAFQTGSSECHSGYYHGAAEAYFRDRGTANLAEDLALICGSELNPFMSHQCFHGVGHGLTAFADYEIVEALANCDLLPQGLESCYTGVFMENIVGGLSPTGGPSTDYLSDDPQFPCNAIDEKYRPSCYFYQTSRMVQLFNYDFSLVAAECGVIDPSYQQNCFESMGRDVGGVHFTDNPGAILDCETAPSGDPRIWCLSGAVQNTFWDPTGQDQALDFCALLQVEAEKAGCYETIFNRAPLVLATEADLQAFCGKAEPAYRDTCLAAVTNS